MEVDEVNYDRIYELCPFIYSAEKDGIFDGLIAVESNTFIIQLRVESIPSTIGATLIITDGEESRNIRLPAKYTNIFDLAENLQREIELACDPSHNATATVDTSAGLLQTNTIQNEIKTLKDSNYNIFIEKLIDNDNECVTIRGIPGYDSHFLKLGVDAKNRLFVLESSLPVDDRKFFQGINSKASATIKTFITAINSALKELDDFYANMNTINTLCCVVDPPESTMKSSSRTIKYNDRVHIQINIDPFNTSSISVNILGPINEISELREKYTERVQDWDTNLDIYKNLLKIFDLMYFPMKNDVTNAEEELEMCCRICFAYHMENEVPLVVCDNTKCNSIFHGSCLQEWFQKMRSTQRSYLNVIFGICPCCKSKISKKLIT